MKPFHTTLLPLITPKEVYERSDQFDIFRGSDKAGTGWTQHLGEEARSWQKIGTASNLEQPATLTRTRGETSTSSCKKTSMHVSGCKDLTLEPGSPCWVYSCDAYESLHQLQQEKKTKKKRCERVFDSPSSWSWSSVRIRMMFGRMLRRSLWRRGFSRWPVETWL